MSSIILFLKSHIAGYTRRDGTYVKPHNRKGGPAAHAGSGQLALFTTPAVPAQDDPEADLRAMWTQQGVPKEKQDELIAAIGEKAAPGAKVGPFTIGGSTAQKPEAQAREAVRSAKTGPTDDEAADPRRKYYVTMAREGRGVARLAGPFDTHDEALAHVDRAREEAQKVDPRASFDSFGTAGVVSDSHRPGVLNARLGIGASAAPAPAANGSKFGTLFHGSAKPFEKYDMSRSGKGGGYRHQGDAVYLTSDQKGYARYFAGTSASKESFRGSYGGTMSKKEADEMERSEGAVMPATLDPSAKILDMRSSDVPDDVKKLFDTSVGDPEIAKRLSKRVRELGYDGIAFVEPNAPEGWKLQHNATTVAVYNPDKVRFHADKAVRGADLQTAPAPVTVASRKRIRDPIEGSHTELTLSNGKVARIQRMSSGSTMGLAGWHDLDGGQYSYLDDTEEGAIKELLRRHNAAS